MSVANLVAAANGGVPGNVLKPHNCHEAALGWVLMAKYPALLQVHQFSFGVEKAWMSLRSLADKYGSSHPKQLTGTWMSQHIYNRGFRLVQPPFTHGSFFLGDVIFMGTQNAPHHSMVIVQKNGIQSLARGFNNAGAFGGPYMGWDPILRDLTDATRWDSQNRFMGNNGPCMLYSISYGSICHNIPDDLNF